MRPYRWLCEIVPAHRQRGHQPLVWADFQRDFLRDFLRDYRRDYRRDQRRDKPRDKRLTPQYPATDGPVGPTRRAGA